MRRGAQEAADAAGRRPAGAGGRARDRRRQADADRREPDPDRHPGARRSRRAARARSCPALVKANAAERADRDRGHAASTPRPRPTPACTTATFVGSDNYEGGKLAGEYLVDGHRRQGAGRHPRGHSRARDRRLAAARLPRRASRAPGITIVASQPANWERDQGFNVFQNMLQAHPDIDTRVRLQRSDGARRDRGDRRRRQDRQDPRRRLRRAGRCEEGDRGGDDGRVGGAVPVRDGARPRSRAR